MRYGAALKPAGVNVPLKSCAYARVDVWLWEDEWQWDIGNIEGFQKNLTLRDESETMQLTNQNAALAAD